MGYCMYMRDQQFDIKAENKAGAFAAIKKLLSQPSKVSGGVYHRGETISSHFAWVNMQGLSEAETFGEAMFCWRWEITETDKGDVYRIEFLGEKLGDDEVLWKAIAPFVEEGSFIEMQGEDGLIWRWHFTDGAVVEETAKIVWE